MSFEFDDDNYPGSTAVLIRVTWDGHGTFVGSGVLVGRNDILTAAHVIYNARFGGFADDIKLYPSYDPDSSFNDSVDWSVVHYYPNFDPDGDGRLFPGDFNAGTLGQTELDIALFTLSEAAGDRYGYMGIDWAFAGGKIGVLGYPVLYGLQPIYDDGSVTKARFSDSAFIYSYDLEVNPGNSGGAIYYDYGFGPYVVGIVSTGIAAVNVAGHRWWLERYIRENDVAIGGGTFDPDGSETVVNLSNLIVDGFADSRFMRWIKDYDGNTFGNAGSWKHVGSADIQGDGDLEHVFVNGLEGRWATVGPDSNSQVNFDDHGANGDTRVVGTYIDPLVESGAVRRFSSTDSQQRFQNDLRNDNLKFILGHDDYDNDGIQEIYMDTHDNGSVLRMLMHTDGNIRYANYQSEADLQEFMQQNGVSASVWGDWFSA